MLQRIASLVVVLLVMASGLVEAQRRHPVSGRVLAPTMSVAEARMELEAEGFARDTAIDVLPWQHIIVPRLK